MDAINGIPLQQPLAPPMQSKEFPNCDEVEQVCYAQDVAPASPVKAKPGAVMDVAAFDAKLDKLTHTHSTDYNESELLIDGKTAYAAMRSMIKSAEKTVHLETFIFRNDKASNEIADLLIEKAKKGVKVRVLIDWIGSIGTAARSVLPGNDVVTRMEKAGIEVRFAHKPKGAEPSMWDLVPGVGLARDAKAAASSAYQRDHRKLLIIDGKEGMTGGMNIASEYKDDWHDVMVTVKGMAVTHMQGEFVSNWGRNGGYNIDTKDGVFSPSHRACNSGGRMRVITSDTNSRQIETAYFEAIKSAKKNINLESAYFTDDKLVGELINAAKRGVKVRIIVPGLNDLSVVDAASRYSFRDLLKAGAEVYLYPGRIMHTKAMSVDGVWATIGSANGTNRSFRGANQELNVAYSDPFAVATIDKNLFEKDFSVSSKVTKPGEKTWKQKLANWVDDLF